MRVRMKNLMGVMEGGSVPALSNLEDALKAEQKVSVQRHTFFFFCELFHFFFLVKNAISLKCLV